MKILVIGDGNSIYIYGYIKNILVAPENTVILATESLHVQEYRSFYEKNGVHVEIFNDSIYHKVKYWRTLFGGSAFGRMIRRKYGVIEYIHIHGLNRFRGDIAIYAKSDITNILITVWGSELLRANQTRLNQLEKYYRAAKKISFENEKMKSIFSEKYERIDADKYCITVFGNEVITNIEKLDSNLVRNDFWTSNHLQNDTIVIAIGYSRTKAHQHVAVIRELIKLSSELQSKIAIVLPLNYGPQDTNYDMEIEDALSLFQGIVIKSTEYLTGEALAKFRCCADIFIHMQTTDSQSMTVIEYLYAGAVLVNASWLTYEVLDVNEVEYVKAYKMEEVSVRVDEIINSMPHYKEITEKNREKLKELFSWSQVSGGWNMLFQK